MARTDTLGNFLTDVADAIRTKTGGSAAIMASDFDTEIENIPSGGTTEAEKKDINFYDYDGTRLFSYTKSEALALETLPVPNVTHNDITFQEWNWTLTDIKNFLNEGNWLDVGAFYTINDNSSIKIYLDVKNDKLTYTIKLYLTGSTTINWGDGTPDTVITYTGNQTATHTYSENGLYVISITSASQITVFGNSSYMHPFIYGGDTSSSIWLTYTNNITKICLDGNVLIGGYAFISLYNVSSISVSNTVKIDYNANYGFGRCYSLKYLTVPKQGNISYNFLGGIYLFSDCTNLIRISISRDHTGYSSNLFNGCYNLEDFTPSDTITTFQPLGGATRLLKRLQIPKNITSVRNWFTGCWNLDTIIMPSGLTTFDNEVCYAIKDTIKYIDCSNCTQVPTLSNSNVYRNVDTRIIVPDSLYNDWVAASNWSTISSIIVKASEV